MAQGIPTLGYLHPLPAEIILNIDDYMTNYQAPVSASILWPPSPGPWIEATLKEADVSDGHLRSQIREFRQTSTFRFMDAYHFWSLTQWMDDEARQDVHSIEIDSCWIFAATEMVPPSIQRTWMKALQQYPNLRRLTLRIGACIRRWLSDVPKEVRDRTHRQSVANVATYLPDLPAGLELKLVMDSRAQWNGGLPAGARSTVVEIVCGRDIAGRWRSIDVNVEERD